MGSATAKSSKNKDGVILSDERSEESKDPYTRQPIDEQAAPPKAVRHRLPEERLSITHKFAVGGHEGYLTVGLYKEGVPGEIFITMAKEGSTVSGLMDSFACAVSIGLQHGVPLKLLCEKFAHTRFEPSGWSGNQDIGYAKSIMDYVFRWLSLSAALPHRPAAGPVRRPASQVRKRPASRHPGRAPARRPSATSRKLLRPHRDCHHEAEPRDLLLLTTANRQPTTVPQATFTRVTP